MISFSSKYRSAQSEIMDDFKFQGKEMELLLTDLKRVNKWLGGNKVTISGIRQLLKKIDHDRKITILDIGCGDGELLRICSRKFPKFEFIGLDANEHIIHEARKRSEGYDNIRFIKADIFSEEIKNIPFDIALCTLFLHHFKDKEIEKILRTIYVQASIGLVVNDLERSKLAFVLFKIVSTLLRLTKTAKNDGLVSIARAFKRAELNAFSKEIEAHHRIKWMWAFRYRWVIEKI